MMPGPALRSVQPDVYIISRFNEFIRKLGTAAGAKNYSSLPKSSIDGLVPPADVAKLHNVAPRRVKLGEDRFESCFSKAIAWRKLKQKAAHTLAKRPYLNRWLLGMAKPLKVSSN